MSRRSQNIVEGNLPVMALASISALLGEPTIELAKLRARANAQNAATKKVPGAHTHDRIKPFPSLDLRLSDFQDFLDPFAFPARLKNDGLSFVEHKNTRLSDTCQLRQNQKKTRQACHGDVRPLRRTMIETEKTGQERQRGKKTWTYRTMVACMIATGILGVCLTSRGQGMATGGAGVSPRPVPPGVDPPRGPDEDDAAPTALTIAQLS